MRYKDWDSEYQRGTHWEDKPSKHISEFVKYLKNGDKILDVGCGAGRNTIYLFEKGFNVVGTDISKIAISKAKDISKKKCLSIIFKIERVEKTEFRDNSFDKIYCEHVLQSTEFDKAVIELNRILKPGGILFIVMCESTIYKDKTEQHQTRQHDDIISEFRKYFIILHEKVTESDDEDRYGMHHHVKLEVVLQKKCE